MRIKTFFFIFKKYPVVEIKLIDVPGTIYRSEINQGEVCIHGPTIFKGK